MQLRLCVGLVGLGILVLFLGLPGCGGPALAPVNGVVTFQKKPVREAMITFAPIGAGAKTNEPGKAATGFTDPQGTFQLSTYKPLDGALVGKHRVTVTLDDTNPARAKRNTELVLEVKSGGNEVSIELEQ